MADQINEQKEQIQPNNYWEHRKHRLLFGFVIFLILVLVFMFGMATSRLSRDFYSRHPIGYNTGGYGRFGWQNGNGVMMAPSTNSNQIEISGVVTNINGDKVTVVGGGTSNIITTDSSTQYIGANSLTINDTVSIVGQYNNNTLTATTITIN